MIDVSMNKNKSTSLPEDLTGVISRVGYDKIKKANYGELVTIDLKVKSGQEGAFVSVIKLQNEYELLIAKDFKLENVRSLYISGEKFDPSNPVCVPGSVIAIEGKKSS